MKKVIFAFILLAFSVDVYAAQELYECSSNVLETSRNALQNVTYSLSYADWAIDHEGNPLEGYIELTVPNFPDGYKIVIETKNDGTYTIEGEINFAVLQGGVYTLKYYNKTCSTVIKAANIRIPYYKTYCGVNVDCNDNPWWDGTYENTASNQNKAQKTKISTVLVVILTILIIIIAIFITIIIKRRRDRAQVL